MSASEMSIFGGQPSITTPIPLPCDEPKAVTRKRWPKVLPIVAQTSCLWGEQASSVLVLAARMAARPTAEAAGLLNRIERGFQIVDQVAHIFHADGEPNKRISDTKRLALLLRHRCVRHERGVIDETFDAAQTFREREQVCVLEKTARSGEIGFQHDRNHPAKAAHLRAREIMLRMRPESRVTD